MPVSRAGHRILDAESGVDQRPAPAGAAHSGRYSAGPPSAASTTLVAVISGPAMRMDTSPARSP